MINFLIIFKVITLINIINYVPNNKIDLTKKLDISIIL